MCGNGVGFYRGDFGTRGSTLWMPPPFTLILPTANLAGTLLPSPTPTLFFMSGSLGVVGFLRAYDFQVLTTQNNLVSKRVWMEH